MPHAPATKQKHVRSLACCRLASSIFCWQRVGGVLCFILSPVCLFSLSFPSSIQSLAGMSPHCFFFPFSFSEHVFADSQLLAIFSFSFNLFKEVADHLYTSALFLRS
jgi:hypothetical protein